MSLAGKRDGFDRSDLTGAATAANVKPKPAAEILERVRDAVDRWHDFADKAGVPKATARAIANSHRCGW